MTLPLANEQVQPAASRVPSGAWTMQLCAWVAVLPLTACVSTPEHATLAEPAPLFSPAAFFSGNTTGEASLKVIFKGSTPVHVMGQGRVEPDGTLVLVQRVTEGDNAPTTRTWRIRSAGDNRYTGSLTDAEGPIEGDVNGNRLHLRFTAKGGLGTEQWLYLQAGGQVALNRMVVRKFGVPVASLEETIRRAQ
ncbi:MAG: DUF3833 family protein [Variovorax sp.]